MATKSKPGKMRPCPICGRPAVQQNRPFCSPHCADVDLSRWLGGRYRIATEESPEDGAAAGSDGDDA